MITSYMTYMLSAAIQDKVCILLKDYYADIQTRQVNLAKWLAQVLVKGGGGWHETFSKIDLLTNLLTEGHQPIKLIEGLKRRQ